MGLATMEKKVESRWLRLGRVARWVIIVLVVILVAVRLSLPWVIKRYVNQKLSRIPNYSGHVEQVSMHLWRGAYEIIGTRIFKSEGKVPVPLFSAPSIDLAIEWKELFHGSIVGTVIMTDPQVNFVSGPTEATSQAGFQEPWGKTLAGLFPFDINRFEVRNGDIHFRDTFKEQPIDIYMKDLHAVATNLTNARVVGNVLPAGLQASALTIGGGGFNLHLRMNPLDPAPTFEVNAALTNVDLTALNPFLRGYGKFDVERGNFQLFTSVASVHGNYKGNVKVMFQNLDVFSWQKEKHKNILQIFWEAIVGVAASGFKNHPHNQLATDVPISGSFTNTKVDLWGAVGSLLHNAFIRALLPKIDQPAHLQDVGGPPAAIVH
ncbi:MAG TPA: DUF748 domain-containing protein [Verrucomicrobiae bacterium]|nr:DUF748 domain-containing protein [Verrucomicrobiae bacterium]